MSGWRNVWRSSPWRCRPSFRSAASAELLSVGRSSTGAILFSSPSTLEKVSPSYAYAYGNATSEPNRSTASSSRRWQARFRRSSARSRFRQRARGDIPETVPVGAISSRTIPRATTGSSCRIWKTRATCSNRSASSSAIRSIGRCSRCPLLFTGSSTARFRGSVGSGRRPRGTPKSSVSSCRPLRRCVSATAPPSSFDRTEASRSGSTAGR